MSSSPRHLRIFLASPGDVVEEREIALAVLDDLPYDPLLRGRITIEDVAWDKRGAGAPILAGVTPQDSIGRGLPKPSECAIVVVIFWSRMGTPLPASYQKDDGSRYESGTEWEYEEAVSAFREHGAPYVLLYRRKQPVLLNADDPEFEERRAQYEKVKQFFAALRNDGGHAEYGVPGDFRERLEHDLKSLIARLLEKPGNEAPSVALPAPWPGSPFPGLRAFTATDAPIFFGREREIDAVIARIMEHPFVAVVGASGSGKSSLVAAGVIPRLQLIAGSAGTPAWLPLQLTPDRLGTGDPFASLAAAVLHALPQTQQKGLATKLREDPGLLASLLPSRTLIFVDQFEELFTTIPASLRAPFIDVLQRVHTIITVRADFYGNCVEMPALARLVENSTYPLAAPGAGALYEMITKPAARAALTFEDGLAQRVLDDTGDEPGALALMAYTLDELHRRGLTHAAYEELGGVQGAIGKRSENVFSSLSDDEKAALPRVFRELVEVNEHGTLTRQRASYARVAATTAARQLTDALTEARLLVQSRGEENEPVVEVAHEALFRSWSRLAEWIGNAADDLRLLRQVRTAAAEWDRNGRLNHFLWLHERMEPVYALRDRTGIAYEPVVDEFIRPEAERIVDVMRTKPREVRQFSLIERLGEIGPTATAALLQCLQYADSPRVQRAVIQTLGQFGDNAIPHLLTASTDPSSSARHRSIDALAEVAPGAGAHLLTELLADDDQQVRRAAIFLAAEAQANDAIPVLIASLHDLDETVRSAAVCALATFYSHQALDGLVAVAVDRSRDVSERVDIVRTFALLAGSTEAQFRWSPDYDRVWKRIAANALLRDVIAATKVVEVLASVRNDHSFTPAANETLQRLLNREMLAAYLALKPEDDALDKFFDAAIHAADYVLDILIVLLQVDAERLRLRAAIVIQELALRYASHETNGWDARLWVALRGAKLSERLMQLSQHDHNDRIRDVAKLALEQIAHL